MPEKPTAKKFDSSSFGSASSFLRTSSSSSSFS